jgi:flagella basal body P-ring formation protein FlgA
MRQLVAVILAAGSAWAGCLAPSGPRILVRDLSAIMPEFAAATDLGTPVAYSPMAGVQRKLTAAELARAAAKAGLVLADPREVCFEWPMAPLTAERITAALRESVGDPAAAVEIIESMNGPVPGGPLQFSPAASTAAGSGAAIPFWRGSIRYGSDHDFHVWVRARVRLNLPRVVALESLHAGRLIRADQVKVDMSGVEATARGAATTLDQVVGRIPRIHIAAGSNVPLDLLETPNAVERGEHVKLQASDPGSTITTEAAAETAGHLGDVIMVRNLSSGKRLRAQIKDRGLVILAAQGGSH